MEVSLNAGDLRAAAARAGHPGGVAGVCLSRHTELIGEGHARIAAQPGKSSDSKLRVRGYFLRFGLLISVGPGVGRHARLFKAAGRLARRWIEADVASPGRPRRS